MIYYNYMTTNAILIIDDQDRFRSRLKRIIGPEGFVYEAASLKAAGKILNKESVDFIV
jgi:DNA-binding response OmpR family regulator